jgi:hypothetical protein
MNLSLATYVTAKEVKNRALDNSDNEGFKLKGDITADSSNDSKPDFDDSDDNVFDSIIRNDYNVQDNFIDVN